MYRKPAKSWATRAIHFIATSLRLRKAAWKPFSERTRRKPNLANRVDEATEQAVIEVCSGLSRLMVRHALPTNCARQASSYHHLVCVPSGCGTVWPTSRTVSRRWRPRWPRTGIILTEAQVAGTGKEEGWTMRPMARSRLPIPAIWAHRTPSMWVRIKGVGRVYQQTYIDTYCKVAHAKLYTYQDADHFGRPSQ